MYTLRQILHNNIHKRFENLIMQHSYYNYSHKKAYLIFKVATINSRSHVPLITMFSLLFRHIIIRVNFFIIKFIITALSILPFNI